MIRDGSSPKRSVVPRWVLAAVVAVAVLMAAFPTARATATTTLFSDDFEAGSLSQWTVAGGTWGVQTGTGTDTTKVAGQTNSTITTPVELVAGSSNLTDYTVQADVQPSAPTSSASLGVTARRQDTNNNYQFLLKNSNQWYLGKKVNGTWTGLGQGTFAFTAGTWYTLALTVSGTSISATINGSKVGSATDSTFTGGGFSLRTSSVASYDNVSVTTGSSTVASPTSTPTNPATAAPTSTPGTVSTLAADSLNRTYANGWGNADTGGFWTTVGIPANWSTSPGAGSIAVAAGGEERAYLSKVNTQDVDMVTKVALPTSTQSNNAWFYLQGRYTSAFVPTYYQVGIGQGAGKGTIQLGGLRSDGTVLGTTVDTGIGASGGAVIWLHVQLQGANPTTIRARAWVDGASEPSAWSFTTTDSNAAEQVAGNVGIDALNQDTAAAHTYSIQSYQATGAAVATTPLPPYPTDSSTHHYMYVFPNGEMDVYDMDNNHALVRRESFPTADDKGAITDYAHHFLYVSECGTTCTWTSGSLIKYDLVTDTIVWIANYQFGLDAIALTKDNATMYVADGEGSTDGLLHILDTNSGGVKGSILVNAAAHNLLIGLSGKHVYTGGFQNQPNYKYLMAIDTSTNAISQTIGPYSDGVGRPFTINGNETIIYNTQNNFLGFYVASPISGKILYTVPVQGFTWTNPWVTGAPSHGISISPDEKELYVMDGPNSYVHVFDITGVPNSAPVQVANIPLDSITGKESNCTTACEREGWVLHSRDGRFVYVADAGDVIDTSTRTIVARLTPLANTRDLLEIDWQNGAPSFATPRYGLGYVTGSTPTPNPTSASGPTPTSTNTPIPTNTSVATPTSTVLFSDNFESDPIGSVPAGWTVSNGTWSVTQGTGSDTTHVATQSDNNNCHCNELLAGSASWTDYTVQADIQASSGTTGFALAARRQDLQNNYQVILKNGNQWYLGKFVGGIWTTLGTGTFAYTPGTWYTIVLSMQGTTISASINGTQLASATDTSFSSGAFALHTSVAASYDNVIVTTSANISTSTPVPTNTPGASPTPTNTPIATAPPTTLLSDDFESGTLSNWTVSGGTWVNQQGTGTDTTKVASQTNSNGATDELVAGSSSWTDYTVRADVQAPSNGNSFGLTARRIDVNDSYQFTLKNGNQWLLGKKVTGNWFTLASGSFTYSSGTWYTLSLKVNGTTISASINGTQMASRSDSGFSSGGFSLRTTSTPSYDNVQVTSP